MKQSYYFQHKILSAFASVFIVNFLVCSAFSMENDKKEDEKKQNTNQNYTIDSNDSDDEKNLNQSNTPSKKRKISQLSPYSNDKISTLGECEQFFQSNVMRLSYTLPLSEGSLREEGGNWYQIIAGQQATKTEGSSTSTLSYEVKFQCSTIRRHFKWDHHNNERKSYEKLSVIVKKGDEERDTCTQEVGQVIDYTYDSTTVQFNSDERQDNRFNITISDRYKKADGSYFIDRNSRDTHLTLIHTGFRHGNIGTFPNNSLQTVRGFFINPHNNESIPVSGMENYVVRRTPYQHHKIFHDWKDCNDTHKSTKRYKVYINPEGAFTPEQITEESKIVGYVLGTDTTDIVNHIKNWTSYTIPHNNLSYK